jgi:hypothetical protein
VFGAERTIDLRALLHAVAATDLGINAVSSEKYSETSAGRSFLPVDKRDSAESRRDPGSMLIQKFARDSLLEGEGFEPSVPRPR